MSSSELINAVDNDDNSNILHYLQIYSDVLLSVLP